MKSLVFLVTIFVTFQAYSGTSGKAIYEQKCQSCHGPKGEGVLPGARNFKTDTFKNGDSLDGVKKSITDGIPKTVMTPFKGRLKAKEIEDVAKYVLTLRKGSGAKKTKKTKK